MRTIAELLGRPKQAETPVVDVRTLAEIANAKPEYLRQAAMSFRANESRDLFFLRNTNNNNKKGKLASMILGLDKAQQIEESLKDNISGDKSIARGTKAVHLQGDCMGIFLMWQDSRSGRQVGLMVEAADDGRKRLFVSDTNKGKFVDVENIIDHNRKSWKEYVEALGEPEKQVGLLKLGLWAMQYAK